MRDLPWEQVASVIRSDETNKTEKMKIWNMTKGSPYRTSWTYVTRSSLTYQQTENYEVLIKIFRVNQA